MNKRKLAVLLTTVSLLGVVGIGSTLAYFTDKTDVQNTVTMGNVNISVTEPVFDEITGGSKTITDVLPGQVIEKDPTISLEGSSADAYIRVKLDILVNGEVAEDSVREAVLAGITDNGVVFASESDDWTLGVGGYYYYNGELSQDDKDVLMFDQVTIPNSWTNEMANAELKITIQAEAIQADYLDGVIGRNAAGKIDSWNLTQEISPYETPSALENSEVQE